MHVHVHMDIMISLSMHLLFETVTVETQNDPIISIQLIIEAKFCLNLKRHKNKANETFCLSQHVC